MHNWFNLCKKMKMSSPSLMWDARRTPEKLRRAKKLWHAQISRSSGDEGSSARRPESRENWVSTEQLIYSCSILFCLYLDSKYVYWFYCLIHLLLYYCCGNLFLCWKSSSLLIKFIDSSYSHLDSSSAVEFPHRETLWTTDWHKPTWVLSPPDKWLIMRPTFKDLEKVSNPTL